MESNGVSEYVRVRLEDSSETVPKTYLMKDVQILRKAQAEDGKEETVPVENLE